MSPRTLGLHLSRRKIWERWTHSAQLCMSRRQPRVHPVMKICGSSVCDGRIFVTYLLHRSNAHAFQSLVMQNLCVRVDYHVPPNSLFEGLTTCLLSARSHIVPEPFHPRCYSCSRLKARGQKTKVLLFLSSFMLLTTNPSHVVFACPSEFGDPWIQRSDPQQN